MIHELFHVKQFLQTSLFRVFNDYLVAIQLLC